MDFKLNRLILFAQESLQFYRGYLMIFLTNANVKPTLIGMLMCFCCAANANAETWLCKGSIYAAPFYYLEVAELDFEKQLWRSRWTFGCSHDEVAEFFEMEAKNCISNYLTAIKQSWTSPIYETNQNYHPLKKVSEDAVYLRFEIINRDGSTTDTQIFAKDLEKDGLRASYTQTFGQPSYRPNFDCELMRK